LTAAAIKSSGTLSVTNAGTSEITGIISDGGSALAVTKAGAGQLTLSGINTYTGSTTISAGELSIYDESGLGANPVAFVANQLIFNGGTIFNGNGAPISFSSNRGVTLTGNGTIHVNADQV
jgi:fibronectin-binding autotransporter adhesin